MSQVIPRDPGIDHSKRLQRNSILFLVVTKKIYSLSSYSPPPTFVFNGEIHGSVPSLLPRETTLDSPHSFCLCKDFILC